MRDLDSGITLQKLEIFCCVVELGSVTRAAERIGVAQPVVTSHIKSLEAKLGVTLFERVGRTIRLTEAGHRVFAWASEVAASKRQMEQEIANLLERGAASVSIAASITTGSYMLPDVIIAFHSAHPEATISTHVSNSRQASEAVRNGECDFGLLILEKENTSDDLVTEVLWSERLVLVASSSSTLVGESVDLQRLATVPFVTGTRTLTRRAAEDARFLELGVVRQNIVLELGHPESIKRAVRSDVGVALLFERAVREELERGLLRKVEVPGFELSIPVILIHRRGKVFTPLQNALIEQVRSLTPLQPTGGRSPGRLAPTLTVVTQASRRSSK